MTKNKDQVTVRFSEEIRRLAAEEKEKCGYKNVSTVYQLGMKFYFENKDNLVYRSDDEIDDKIEEKMLAKLKDASYIKELRAALGRSMI